MQGWFANALFYDYINCKDGARPEQFPVSGAAATMFAAGDHPPVKRWP
jgi:hypothetical protein